jgi:hypothetical protein
MNPIPFLYAAYIVTWVIHGVFILTLITRYRIAVRVVRVFQYN